MKKTILTKLAASVAAISMLGSAAIVPTYAALPPDQGGASVQFIAITSTTRKITLQSGGVVNCHAQTTVASGHRAGLLVELQQYKDNNWTTIKSWSKSASNSVTIDEDYSVSKGYKYQLRVTHSSYNSSGKLLEATVQYSNTVNYGSN